MKLDIDLWVKEYLKTENITLYFDLANKDILKLSHGTSKAACECFNSDWNGLTPGFELGKYIEDLYKTTAERLAKFIKVISKEEIAPIHYSLISNSFKEVHGICVAGTHYKSAFIRNLTSDELRDIELEVKKALEGL